MTTILATWFNGTRNLVQHFNQDDTDLRTLILHGFKKQHNLKIRVNSRF
jgi:hypothetical protein